MPSLSHQPSADLLRRWPLLLLLALLPIFGVGMFARGIWTPDEPREIAISWRMVHQDSKAVPTLGSEAFCEKPPLLYWLSGASMATFGKSPAAARVPNFLFALIGAFSLAWLAHAMVSQTTPNAERRTPNAALAALAAGLAFATMELTFQVSIWLASDAPLLMGVCVALLGAWRGLNAAPGRAKLGWYLLMHLGLLIGFFSKNAIAWIVPGLAVGAWIAWEWRWRELLRWELWLGFVFQAACIAPWILAVKNGPDGAEHLRIFFVENLVGRFLPAYKGTKDYGSGHANWFGKYLIELPVYLLPWLFIAIAALGRAWNAVRTPSPERAAWRFALCIIVPNMALLSIASTARGIYLAPVLTGFAVLIGLWASTQIDDARRTDRWALVATGLLLAVIGAVMLPGAFIAQRFVDLTIDQECWLLAGCGTVIGVLKILLITTHARRGNWPGVLRETIITLVAVFTIALLAAPRVVDPTQDLGPVAHTAAKYGTNLALYDADETTIAAVEYHTGLIPPVIAEFDDAPWLAKPATRALRRMPRKAAYEPCLADMVKRGWQVIEKIDVPNGRRYVVFGPGGK